MISEFNTLNLSMLPQKICYAVEQFRLCINTGEKILSPKIANHQTQKRGQYEFVYDVIHFQVYFEIIPCDIVVKELANKFTWVFCWESV